MKFRIAIKSTVLLSLCLCISAVLYAQQPRLYTAQQGLASSDIRDIYIDGNGVAWVSGAGALQMFDGDFFYDISLRDKDTGSHICDVVYGIEQLHDNIYLVRTNNGLFSYDRELDEFTRIYLNDREKKQGGYSIGKIHPYPKTDCKLVVTEGQGMFILNTKTLTIDVKETEKVTSALNLSFVVDSYTDSKGRLWVSDIVNQIVSIDIKNLKKTLYNIEDAAQQATARNAAQSMCEADGKIYFGTNQGVLYYDEKSQEKTIRLVEGSTMLGAPTVAMLHTKAGNVLVGTDSHGLWEMGAENGEKGLKKYQLQANQFNLDYSKVKCLVEDKEGNILIGMLQKGLMVIPPHSDTFRYHAISPKSDGNNASCITSMAVDDQLNYWITTDGQGVFKTDGLHLATAHQINTGLRSLLVQSVAIDKRQTAWVGSYGGGVQYYDGTKFVTPAELMPLQSSLIMVLEYDGKKDILYIGSNGNGVFKYDIQKKELTHYDVPASMNPWVTSLHVAENGVLYIGTVYGLYYINETTNQNGRIEYDSPRSSIVQSITSFGKSLLLGTSEGLLLYNQETAETTFIIQDERIMSIEQTSTDFWVSTASEIVSVDKKTFKPTHYTSFGGFFIGEFHKLSSVHPVEDDILFGGDNGIICFTPSLIKNKKKIANPLLFCQLKTGEETYIYVPEKIKLSHDQNSFSMSFSVPYYSAPARIHYNYMLEGYDKTWRTCKGKPEVYYSSLPTGSYTLKVRAYFESEDEVYEEKMLKINVSAPWYGSWWAWCIYIIIFGLLAHNFYRAYKVREHQRQLLHRARANEQLKEARLQMFTSITHELRTPLTMILSPLNQLSATYKDEGIQNLCNVMKRNCDRLLNIVKQITDIRHIDSGQLKMHFMEVDFVKYSENIFATFSANANLKNISFISECSDNVINIWLDPVNAEKIIVNLLSNAFKFTPDGGKIIVRTNVIEKENTSAGETENNIGVNKQELMELRVYNSGSHISDADLPHLFERFYQGENIKQGTSAGRLGSGIGLNLVNELVSLHHGEVSVHNVEPDGVEFIVTLPLGNAHLTEEEMVVADEEETKEETPVDALYDTPVPEQGEIQQEDDDVSDTNTEHTARKQTVLIVDDDKELCEYIANELGHFYNTIVAHSGNSAWQVVLKQRPDVMVTDVRMPDGDGIELCKRIKGNPETDNIPVIMLTSENSDDAQLRSLNLNVDYFISKPFNLMILRGAIGQVLRVRENLLQRVNRKDIGNDYDTISMDSADDKLFDKINESVLKHLDECEFGVEELADEIGISRVHLNRKMKERYGITPRQFMKSFKLKQAAYLLIHNNVNISEVVYKLGFSSHSFFSSSFHEYFGMTPKEFVAYYSEHLDDETLKKLLE